MRDRLIEVFGGTTGSNRFERILAPLLPEASDLRWSIRTLPWAVGPGAGTLEAQAERTPAGVAVTFEELQSPAGTLDQAIDGLFVGLAEDAPAIPDNASSETESRMATTLVAAFDSSSWIMGAPDTLLHRFRAGFADVRPRAHGEAPLTT